MSGEMESIFQVYQLADLSHSILGGSHKIIQDLLAEVWECWKKANKCRVSVYASDTGQCGWLHVASHPKHSPESTTLDSGVKDLLSDARELMGSRKWYSDRGIPFRRGYLFVSYIRICTCTKGFC